MRMPLDPSLCGLYAYRVTADHPPVLCVVQEHEIKVGEVVIEPFRGPLVSLCGSHASEADKAITALLHEEEEKADPELYRQRHGIV